MQPEYNTSPSPPEPMTEKEKNLAALPECPDEKGPRPNWQQAKIADKSVWFTFEWGIFRLKLNPTVSISAILLIVAFILWCILAQEREYRCLSGFRL